MILGHLPAGYLLTRALVGIASAKVPAGAGTPWLMCAGLLAGIVPDLDIMYHYTIDHKQHLHHSYWTHMPFFWLCLFVVWGACIVRLRSGRQFLFWIVISANVFLHLLLDTITGGIQWLRPFSSRTVVLFHVPSVHDWWVWNFVFHRIFLLEVGIIAGAWLVLIRKEK